MTQDEVIRRGGRALGKEGEAGSRLLDLLPVGVAMMGADGVIHDCNPAFCRLLTGHDGDLCRCELEQYVEPEHHPRMKDALQSKPRNGDARTFDFSLKADGKDEDVHVRMDLRSLGDGVAEYDPCWVAIAVDISEEWRRITALQRAAERAEFSLQLKDEYLASLGHEIRTPLGGIASLLDLLNDTSLSREQRFYVKLAKHAANELLLLVNDILELARIETGRLEVPDRQYSPRELLESVRRTMAPLTKSKGLQLTVEADATVPESLRGAEPLIRQVLINLLGNAAKFTDKGAVFVRAHCQGLSDGGKAVLSFEIADTGRGVPEAIRKRLFPASGSSGMEPPRPETGAGLGLSIVKKLVEVMRGWIEMESRPGRGTTVRVNLPLKTGLATADKGKRRPPHDRTIGRCQ